MNATQLYRLRAAITTAMESGSAEDRRLALVLANQIVEGELVSDGWTNDDANQPEVVEAKEWLTAEFAR